MLRSNKLLIDKYCPMCRVYAAGFVKTGCVEPSTITPYQSVSANILGDTDLERAKTEIALHDTTTGETRYGIDAMIYIVSHSRPLLRRLLRSFFVYSLLKFVYKFITYNRRVLYPCQETAVDRKCIPARHHGFRTLLIFLAASLLAAIASPIYSLLGILPTSWYLFMIVSCTSIFMGTIFRHQGLNQRMDILGNIATVGIMGTIGIWLLYYFKINGIFNLQLSLIFFGGLLVLLIQEAKRRIYMFTNLKIIK